MMGDFLNSFQATIIGDYCIAGHGQSGADLKRTCQPQVAVLPHADEVCRHF